MKSAHIKALDMVTQGDLDGAHRLIKNYQDELACLIHGHLHRKKGQLKNANYWYSRVSRDTPDIELESEFKLLYQMGTLNSEKEF